MNYKQAFNLITSEYIAGNLNPYHAKFCFCGNLENEDMTWSWWSRNTTPEEKDIKEYSLNLEKKFTYTKNEYINMEYALLNTIAVNTSGGYFLDWSNKNHPNYENALFLGMCAALDVLKGIHKNRGENVEEIPFKQRKLQLT